MESGSHPYEKHVEKLFAASRIGPLKNSRVASTKRKDEEGTELSVAKETQAQSAQSKFHREEKEGRGEGCTSEKRIW